MPTTNEAMVRYREIFNQVEDKLESCSDNDVERTLRGRTLEKIIKLAMIHAWTKHQLSPVLDVDSFNWAYDFLTRLDDAYLEAVFENIHRNDVERNARRFINVIIAAGANGITRDALSKASAWLRTNERASMLTELEQHGTIVRGMIGTELGFIHKQFLAQPE
jgi:hypothetical protein